MIELAPVAVTGAALTISLINQFPGGGTRFPVRLANESPYVAVVSALGRSLTLQPYTADVLEPVQTTTVLKATFTALSTPLPPAPVSQLVVTLAEADEQFPGSYPIALPRQLAQFSTKQLLGSITTDGAGTLKTLPLTPPVGCEAISVLISAPVHLKQANLLGSTSGVDYFNSATLGASFPSFDTLLRFAIEQDVDATITAQLKDDGTAVVTAWYTAVMNPEVVFLASQEAIGAQVLAYNQRQIGYEDGATPGGSLGGSMLVSEVQAHPALWQAATAIAQVSVALAAGASATLAAAVVGQLVRLFGASLVTQGTLNTNFGQLEDTASNALLSLNGSQNQYLAGGAAPMPGGVGTGMRIRNTSAVNTSFNGGVSWSQG